MLNRPHYLTQIPPETDPALRDTEAPSRTPEGSPLAHRCRGGAQSQRGAAPDATCPGRWLEGWVGPHLLPLSLGDRPPNRFLAGSQLPTQSLRRLCQLPAGLSSQPWGHNYCRDVTACELVQCLSSALWISRAAWESATPWGLEPTEMCSLTTWRPEAPNPGVTGRAPFCASCYPGVSGPALSSLQSVALW